MATRAECFEEGVRPSFEEEWPTLASQLERFLASRGVDGWLRSDVIQETAARLYPRWEALDRSQPLWNLVATIAVRVTQNHHRKESRIELVADPDPVHRDDVEVRGLQRAQLEKTRSALNLLTTDQRQVLLAEVGEAPSPGGSHSRIKVLRLRARAKLREQLGPWAPSAIGVRLRRLHASAVQKRMTLEMHVPLIANSVVNMVMGVTLAIAGAAGGIPDAHSDSGVEFRDSYANPLATIRGPRTDKPWSARDHTKKAYDGTSRFAKGPRKAGAPADWAEDTKKWGEDIGGWVDDTRKWGSKKDEEWVRDTEQWVRDTEQWFRDTEQWFRDTEQWFRDAVQWSRDCVEWSRNCGQWGRDRGLGGAGR